MILVSSAPEDPVVEHVTAELKRRGASFVVINPAAQAVQADLRCALSWQGSRVRIGELEIDLDDIEAVWSWRPGISAAQRSSAIARFGDAIAASYAWNEWPTVLGDALGMVAPRFVPASPLVLHAAESKLHQLRLATRLGLAAPETLVTNDVDEALDFAAAFDGDVIAKPPSVSMCLALTPKDLFVYTRALRPRDWAAIGALTHAPVMLQRRVAKRLELRVTIVGDRVFAAEIHSQATRRTRVDWRQYDRAHTPLGVHQLPAEVAARCVALLRRLGLRYGAIDLILTPDGEYVFLEINPNGQWQWIEEATGLPITAALCDEIMGLGHHTEHAA